MPVRIEKLIYGGAGLAHTPSGAVLQLPFTLRDELVEPQPLTILSASPHRVAPHCPHFGACGGCQYQHADYPEQLAIKRSILAETMQRANVGALPEITTISGDSWSYRNRIRLRLARVGGTPRAGYSVRNSNDFLPITQCPIAAPLLWQAAEVFLAAAESNRDAAAWFDAADELELFTDAAQQRVLMTLHCRSAASLHQVSFAKAAQLLSTQLGQLTGAAAVHSDARSGRVFSVLAEWGAQGLLYETAAERYWISRGGFFQGNRFLIDAMVQAVCNGRHGQLAWDLFAGVGLFSRVLAGTFERVTAVEANPAAAADLRSALAKLGAQHAAVEQTTLDFLRNAVLQRERPELIVLDPPRAGAGIEACALLAQLRAPQLVYVSCDPTTLARDLRELQQSGYRIESLQLIDLFPQTFHLETIAALTLA